MLHVTRSVPVQARAKARYEAIVTAAQKHYVEVGRDLFSLEVVAEAAGCSEATIYRYFENRSTLLAVAVPGYDDAETILKQIREIAMSKQDAADIRMLAIKDLLGLS